MLNPRSSNIRRVVAVCWIIAVAFSSAFTVSRARAENVVLRPERPTNRVVIWFHGSGGYAKHMLRSDRPEVVDVFLKRGFAVAASDAYGPANWGSPQSVQANLNMIRGLRRAGYDRLFLFGGSMGGLDAMQVIGHVRPEAVALVSPVCNLRGLPLMEAGVEQQWGDRRPEYLSPVSADPERGLPVRVYSSPEDTWVPKSRNADFCARELRRGGARVTIQVGRGEHTNAEMFSDEAVPDFFSAVARRNR